ncbi:hypothetical protein CC78DRAFT_591865 [Lojkania enalia]|uniref:Uncharacterized protein n=1 Tax=Lojkania enalia TaxID=147567 RepID=A0A9P4JZ06_9PLEO|nr:hypothetical protein CC78DRAFT_591865 [Didymosphaeria enalia]
MGVTISHAILSPLSLAAAVIGFISFGFTVATFLNVFWSSIQTLLGAPDQIEDFLCTLKEGLLEERRHLRKVKRRLKSRSGSHVRGRSNLGRDSEGGKGGAGHGRGRGVQHGYFERDLQSLHSAGEDAGTRALRSAIRDMIREFRRLEHPFLKPEFQQQSSSYWSTTDPSTRKPYYSKDGGNDYDRQLGRNNTLGSEYRKCGFRERWLWLRRKDAVVMLSESLSRVETRRTAHDVGQVLIMVGDIGRDLQDIRDSVEALEGRMSRVIGVRRVD